jgi:hypothetical protein
MGRPVVDAPHGIRGHISIEAEIDRAAWTCSAYAQFVRGDKAGRVSGSIFLSSGNEDYVIDIDQEGNPIGVELLHVALSIGH